MKSHMLLMQLVLNDMGTRCRTSTTRDWETITRRYEGEGLSFLTITLPSFCTDFEKSLDLGRTDQTLFPFFRKRGQVPVFLGGFLDLVFERMSGRLLDDPDVDAIIAIRQVTRLFGKLELPCSDTRERKAFTKFIECEQDVRRADRELEVDLLSNFERMSAMLFSDILQQVDEDVYYGRIIPKHGPGSTADKLLGNKKYSQSEWTRRLEEVFPHGEFLFPSWSHFCDSPDVPLLEPGQERPVKVISVPKTQKTPRIIAIEPTCMQYVQQGILESLSGAIDANKLVSKLIGFDDQTPNQRMAHLGSLYGELATLDLSEASDRVSYQLVLSLCKNFPHFREAVDACRSRKADVPGHGVIRLAKYASMGSALCFPMEAMVFLTIVFLGIEKELNRQLTRRDVKILSRRVRVYGDDIIVPVKYVQSVVTQLQAFGLVVNENKSFWTGKFRESCGKEYFAGYDVSIVKVRTMLPSQRRHVRGLISTVSLRNLFYFSGCWGTCRFLDRLLGGLIPFPLVGHQSAALGRHSFLGYTTEKIGHKLHNPLVRGYVVHNRIPPDHLEGSGALLKWFLKRGEQPFADRNHLERAGRPKAVDIKLRWVQAY